MAKKESTRSQNTNAGKWILAIVLIIVIGIFSVFSAAILGLVVLTGTDSSPVTGNVALIKVHGVITSTGTGGIFSEEEATADSIIAFLDEAEADDKIKAVMLEINSPGGSAVGSAEIADRIERMEKPTVSYIREVGASGGYWVAASTDRIYANPMSITGSIGVLGSYLEFSELLDRYNITYQRMVGGEFKDLGTPLKKLTPTEEKILQQKIDKIHETFMQAIAESRGMSIEEVRSVASGEFYLGSEALDLGLIDALGGQQEALTYLEEELDTDVELVTYSQPASFFDVLASLQAHHSFFLGKGIGQEIVKGNAAPFLLQFS